MKKEIWYLCDGNKEDCKRSHCYKKELDGCARTSDINHAINFRKKVIGDRTIYRELICSEDVERMQKKTME